MKKTFGEDLNQLVDGLNVVFGVIGNGFTVQPISLEEMAEGLIIRLAAFEKIAQGEMAICGVAFR